MAYEFVYTHSCRTVRQLLLTTNNVIVSDA
jgi:hypothetical protein